MPQSPLSGRHVYSGDNSWSRLKKFLLKPHIRNIYFFLYVHLMYILTVKGQSPNDPQPLIVRLRTVYQSTLCYTEALRGYKVIMSHFLLFPHEQVQIAKHLVNRYVAHVQKSDVVILSPYREQRSKITELLKGAYEDIKVTTITKSQGKAVTSYSQE